MHPEDQDRVLSHLSDYLKGRAGRYDIEFRLRKKDGAYCWINACGIVIRDVAGRPIRMAGSHTDITERKREEALQDAEKRALELVAKGEQLNDVLAFVCRSVKSLAPSMLCSFMLTDKGGTHLLSAAAPSLSDEYNRAFDRIPIGPTDGSCGNAAYFAKLSVTTDISTDPLWRNYARMALAHGLRSCWSHPILSSSGTLLGTCAVYHQRPREPKPSDLKIVERVSSIAALAVEHARMMEAVKESEARFEAFMRHSPAVTFIKDTDGRYVYGNSQFETLSGMPRGEIIGKTVFDFMPTDIATRLSQIDMAVLASGQTLEKEEALPTSDGTLQHWLVSKFPLDVARRELLGGMAINISERKRVQENLLRTQFAMDQAVDAVYWIDPQARILYTNEAASAMLGYTKEEFLRMTVHDLNPDLAAERWPAWWEETREKKVISLEMIHQMKDGRRIPIDIRVSFLAHGGQEFHCAYVRDISERKHVESALRRAHEELEQRVDERTAQLAQANQLLQGEITERKRVEEAVCDSELRYKLLTDATFDGIAIHDHGILLEVNAGLERIFGYEPGELVGRSIFDLVADESRDLVLSNMRNGVTGPYEAIGRRKDGSTFPGEIVIRPCRHRGKEVRLVAGRDITVRKQLEEAKARHLEELERQVAERTAEIAKLESQRAETEKLAAVGQMAAAVAHEINNPIAGIRNAFTLVKQAVDQAHPHYEFVGMIDREISRVATIVRNMYQLYRKEPSRVEPVHLQLLLRDLDALFAKQLLQRGITFVATLSRPTMTFEVPQSDLLQVLVNLMQNAIDSSRQGGTVRLSVEQEEDIVTISVSDEGSGIAPELLPHIFDPFFTTKTDKDQKGMGLGLSISQSLVMAMGGRIAVQTQPQLGSTFSIVLPQPIPHDRSAVQRNTIKEVLSHEH